MPLKNNWVDKIDGQDDVMAEDVNSIARAVIDLETTTDDLAKQEKLPETTSEDEGKILKVVGGKWSKVSLDKAEGVMV